MAALPNRIFYWSVQILSLPWWWTGQGVALQRQAFYQHLRYWTGQMRQRECYSLEWNAQSWQGWIFSCWIAHATSNVRWTRWYNLRSCPTPKVMGWHFSRTAPFLSQSASHKTSLDQMQIRILPWSAYTLFCTPSNIGAGPQGSPDKVTWPLSRKPCCSSAWQYRHGMTSHRQELFIWSH